MKDKTGQVTIFVIVAIIIVVAILSFFFFFSKNVKITTPKESTPEQVIKNCVREAIEEKMKIILENGGELNPKKSASYLGENYTYLCYQADYFLPCYNLKPAIEESIEQELEDSTKTQVQICFDNWRNEEESKGFEVSGGVTTYSIDILPNLIKVSLQKDIKVSDATSSQEFSNFDFKFLSSAYELIDLTRNIINAESEYCYFEYGGYMLLHPTINIKKAYSGESKVYSIENAKTKEIFKFAVKSCTPKPGL